MAIRPGVKQNTSDSSFTYTALLYGNGPGGITKIRNRNLTNEETGKENYIQESAVFMRSETHGGEDVPIYASGPMGHLFEGTVEQSYIPHAMAYAACIGPIYNNSDRCLKERKVRVSSKATTVFEFKNKILFTIKIVILVVNRFF